ncbi:hypothetical protein Ddc_15345 [Ditylenchus destructor]|nr:hypothetical protein Ddc_15345 [Ditylenchus destructor]
MAARLAKNKTQIENETQEEPKAKKNRLENRISHIATMDNDTTVEVFKYLNYRQLAKNSLASKRFCDLIRTHRHKLALLDVGEISMHRTLLFNNFYVFNSWISSEAYTEWVIQNHYSQQIPLEGQVEGEENTQNEPKFYLLKAIAMYRHPFLSPNGWQRYDKVEVFSACAEPNHENWPTFEHFIRLLADPFIYIRHLELTPQNNVLNLLAEKINSDHNRIQCKKLLFHFDGNVQKLLSWMKSHVLCKEFQIRNNCWSNKLYDEEVLDFFLTGARCTSEISIIGYDLTSVIGKFVKKFISLKNSDECQTVESIRIVESITSPSYENVRVLRNYYEKFIVKENYDYCSRELVFEFSNGNIEKKVQITAKSCIPEKETAADRFKRNFLYVL